MDLEGIVAKDLKENNADEDTIALWGEIYLAFQERGPDAVKTLLTDKVKEIKKRFNRDAKEVKQVSEKQPRAKKAKRSR